MLCPNCGCDAPEGAGFCPGCGSKMPAPFTAEPASMPEPVPAAPVPGKKGTHRVPIIIMALLCVLGLSLFFALPYDSEVPVPEAPDSETPWFSNDGGTLHFYEELYKGSPELTVPDIVDGIPVTALGSDCFAYCDSLTTVILPESLETIHSGAFAGCTAMRGIFIPEGVTYIGRGAFLNCAALEAICIPESVERIEAGAFDNCISLRYILYSGTHSSWTALYSNYIALETQVYCSDGTFVHRRTSP